MMKIFTGKKPVVWGGIECTINRVGDVFTDQLVLGGYYKGASQLEAITSLGINTLRFPILWENHQPEKNSTIDFSRTSAQIDHLTANNIEIIAGLLHHGSGPVYTNLLDEHFPELFAAYAGKVAAQFPGINYYTPVNEPLTTARFSGLYGLWYPHKKNDVSFIKILINELKATVLAMREIRKVNPQAKLVQTEDLGKTYSTPLLSYQASFENERRWLTWDILCGRFTKTHSLWNYFMRLGIKKEDLQFFIDNPCKPDIAGINYYATSERYLDENIKAYPGQFVGGNTLHHYIDVEAARIPLLVPHGPEVLLREVWQRYQIPLVVTEVHLHCSREEQMRWFHDMYETAVKIKSEGVELIAITAWALLGSFGWNKLLTGAPYEYESGAFDISAGYIRPTALAALIKEIAAGKTVTNTLIRQPGWWKRPSRFITPRRNKEELILPASQRPLIIIGKTGTLGKAFSRICAERNIHHYSLGRPEADICNSSMLEEMFEHYHPWAIINTAGYVKVDEAESNKELCYRENTLGPQKLAILCEKHGIKLASFSSDLVFDGEKRSRYVEADTTSAINTYGHSKELAESFLLNVNPRALIIRTAAFFGPWDNFNFIHFVLAETSAGRQITVAHDVIISPTYVPHLVNAALNLLIDDEAGIWHLTNTDALSWYEFAVKAATRAGLDTSLIVAGTDIRNPASRPAYSALSSSKYRQMPDLDTAIEHYFLHKSTTLKKVTVL